jgi:hypothetical protein
MKLLAVLATTLALAGTAAAGSVQPGGKAGVPGFPKIPGKWCHVDINVAIRRVPHTITLDRGRIAQVSPTQIVVRECDGSLWTIPVTSQTIVAILGRPASLFDLRKKEQVETMRIDGGPAVRIRVTSRA